MARVLGAVSMGGAGHLNPLRPVLDAARDLGAETLLIGPAAMHDQLAATGHPFRVGADPDPDAVTVIREQLPTAPPAEATILGNRDLFARLAAGALLPAVEQAVEEWAPDLIVRDPTEYASAVVATRVGLPSAAAAISLAAAEWGSIEAAAPALDEYGSGVVDTVTTTPYLTRFPASLDPSLFAHTLRFREPTPALTPLPDWWPGAGGPLVYLTFGTVFGYLADAAAGYRVLLDAVADLPARVLLTVGRRLDPSSLGAVPANVHVEPWVEQADVVAAADLVVCHGGSGTGYGTLAAGRPLVVVPSFADQSANGRRIEAAGAGVLVVPEPDESGRRVVRTGDTARVTAAIERVLADREYRAAAERIGAEMSAAPTLAEVMAGLLDQPK